jgi:hypothetical protein
MGFTVIGPDHLIGGGHPDFGDTQLYDPSRRPLLGLVENRNAGRSWEPASLLGEVDFHVLEAAHGKVYDFDATGGRFMVSRDRRRWQTRSTASLFDFAVSPVMTSSSSRRPSVASCEASMGPALAAGWRAGRRTAGVGQARGTVGGHGGRWAAMAQRGRRPDMGTSRRAWRTAGGLEGAGRHLYAAVEELGIRRSSDEGASWRMPEGPATG